jgi:NADH-quinone oxidoreductase subunit J
MTMIVFLIAAFLAIVSAIGVVSVKNPLHCALCMIGTMLSLAVIYLLHHAEFIFAIQIMVYAGAVMMLVIFVIFLLDIRKESSPVFGIRFGSGTAIAAGALMMLALLIPALAGGITGKHGEMTEAALATNGSVQVLADALFGPYLLPFEVASLVLLVGLVGAVALAKKRL